MDFRLQNKVAMVAASSKGIGFATAKALADEGARVSICARNESNLNAALLELGSSAIGYIADVSDTQQLETWFNQTVKQLGPVDILVTNTGGPPTGNILDLSDELWEVGIQNTLMNVVCLSRLVAQKMKERGWGRIVHITSLVALDPNPLLPISSTLRAGLRAFTKLQAVELAEHGVTANSVLPGHTLTDRQTHLIEVIAEREGISLEAAERLQVEKIPIKRFARPEEIADVIAFLCSEQASFVTGVSLVVDGAATKAI